MKYFRNILLVMVLFFSNLLCQYHDKSYVAQLEKDSILFSELCEIIKDSTHFKFIENHAKLEKITPIVSSLDSIRYSFVSDDGKQLSMFFSRRKFVAEDHKIEGVKLKWDNKKESYFGVERIDGKKGFGYFLETPKREFNDFEIIINGKQLEIPFSCYSDLYNPHFTHNSFQVFRSSFNNHFYIYMMGADASAAYSVKWIFNNKGFINRIASTDERSIYYLDALNIAP